MTARIIRIVTLVAVTLGALVAVGPATATTSAGTDITIAGRVTDPAGYPLGGVAIRLYDNGADEGSVVATATTDEVGHFRFRNAPPSYASSYRLVAEDVSGRHRLTATEFFTADPGHTTRRHLTMKVAGIIQGTVLTKDGDAPARPATKVVVKAEGRGYNEVKVSANGTFRLGGLPSGSYTLTFEDTANTFATQCYDDVPQVDFSCPGATKVDVTAGRTTTITKQVLHHPLSTLEGTVTDTEGTALEGVSIEILGATEHDYVTFTSTSKDGTWDARGISYVGKVRISAVDLSGQHRTTWYEDTTDFAHATPLRLTEGSEISDITIAMPRS